MANAKTASFVTVTDLNDSVTYMLHASAYVTFKDAINVATSGAHTGVIFTGKEIIGSTTNNNVGALTIQNAVGTYVYGNGTTAIALSSPYSFTPANNSATASFTAKMWNQTTMSGAVLLDTITIPVIFKGATGNSTVKLTLEIPDGNTFSGNIGSPKNVNVKVYDGEVDVTTSATTAWYFNGVLDAELNNLKTLPVYPSDVLGNLTIKVIAIYNSIAYQDSITFLDLDDIYQVSISGMDKIKNSSENVVLTAIAFRGSARITAGFRCRWTDMGQEPPVVLYEGINTTGTLTERGVTFTLTPAMINSKLDILCELSVDTVEQELEGTEISYVPSYDSRAYAAAMSIALN